MNSRNGASVRRLSADGVTEGGSGADRGPAAPPFPAAAVRDGSPAGAHADRGFRCLEQGNTEEALTCFNRVIELEPDNPEAYNNAGYVHEMTDRLSSALYLYRKALAIDDKNVEALINIAHIRDLEGDYHGALQQYRRALAIEPDNVNAHFCLGVLYDRHDMFDEAAGHYRQVLDRDPLHRKAIFNLGNLSIQTGDYDQALELFNLLLEQDPGHAEAWNNIGSLHEELGNPAGALHAWRQCLKLDPLQVKANLNLARVEYASGESTGTGSRNQEIIDRLKFVLALDPLSDQAKDLLAMVEGNGHDFPCLRHRPPGGGPERTGSDCAGARSCAGRRIPPGVRREHPQTGQPPASTPSQPR